MIRFAIYAIVIYICYRVLKSFGNSLFKPKAGVEQSGLEDETELIRDPKCGAYFLRQTGVEAQVNGEDLVFCSQICRDTYIRENTSQ